VLPPSTVWRNRVETASPARRPLGAARSGERRRAGGPGPAPVVHCEQHATLGFSRGRVVEYLDFGPVKLAAGNEVAAIRAVANGAEGRRNVIDTVPGRRGCTPLRDVRMVTGKDGAARVLRPAAVRQAFARGEATVRTPCIVVNCPVI
jgi:hypothetical protein